MPKLSPVREAWPVLPGLGLLNRGKVCDTYQLPGSRRLQNRTDAVSIFDIIMNALVDDKGPVLTMLTHFWIKKLEPLGIPTHFVAAGAEIDQYLPEPLRGDPDRQSRAMVVDELDMIPVELIPREVLTGSAKKPYAATGVIFGKPLPAGLQDGDLLPYTMFTATTKAATGHDEHLSSDEVRYKYPEASHLAMTVFDIGKKHAMSRGIFPADSKFEVGWKKVGGRMVLAIGDEILTPDSSRFWEYLAWLAGRKAVTRKAPPPYDKQLVRQWGIEQGIDQLDPENPEHVAKVHAMEVPQTLLDQTRQTYRYIFWRLTGMKLENYKRDLGIVVPAQDKPHVVMLLGSASDWDKVRPVMEVSPLFAEAKIDVHVMSCDRNPVEAVEFATKGTVGGVSYPMGNVLFGIGSKSLRLPSYIKALTAATGKGIPVVGIALGDPGSQDLMDAQRAIAGIPETPVIMDELAGHVYTGPVGLVAAMDRVINGELPPSKPRTDKPVKMGFWRNY